MSEPKKNTAASVEIAKDLYVFGCASEQRGHTGSIPGDDPVAIYTWAAPKQAPDQQRPLAEIRPDIAAVFQATHGHAPNATALGDAMTVLEGRARKDAPTEASDRLLAMLAGAGSKATQLVKMARENYLFGVTTSGDVYAVPVGGPNIARPLRGGRRSLRAELARLYYDKTKSAAGAQALADALIVLEGESQGTEPTEVALRAGQHDVTGDLVLDLGREDGQAVVISQHGWEVTAGPPVLFWRTNATLPLPIPDRGGSLDTLRDLVNLAGEDWPLAVAWLVAALFPAMPHPVLQLRGEHGTAKSSTARLLTSLVDRCASQLRTAPRNVEDWAVACAGSSLAGDLADRMLTMEPGRITEDSRMSEEDLTAAWRSAHPAALGALLDTASDVLRVLPSVRRSDLPRMADFARVVLAVDKVLGTDGYTRYAEQASRTSEDVADSDSVCIMIRKSIRESWEGSAGDFLDEFTGEKPPKDWPATPQGMGGWLSRAAPVLRNLGWTVDRDRDKRTRTWTIAAPCEFQPAETSSTSPGHSDQAKRDDDRGDGSLPDDDLNVTTHPSRHRIRAGQNMGDIDDVSAGNNSAALPLCAVCGSPLDSALIEVGYATHPHCDPEETP